MRSLQLLIAFLGFSVFQAVHASSSTLIPNDYYSVTLPYELGAEQTMDAKLEEQSQVAMHTLLMRLTGQQRFVKSGLGQKYIAQAKGWLANYNIKPRYEDGVVIGKNIQFHFDAERLKKAFAKQHVKLWTVQQRPSTLVMGTFVQQGRLQKLTSELLDYRIDIDFRDHPENIRLPYFLPETTKNWVFPVEPAGNRAVIQENLLANDQQNLLSFKLIAKGNGLYALDWYLFNLSGVVLQSQSDSGQDRQQLFANMFSEVAQLYVKQGAVKAVRKNHILLNINHISSGDVINFLERELQAQQPMVRSALLTSVATGTAQFDIEYQGDEADLVYWLQNWSWVDYIGETEKQIINVNVKSYLNSTIPAQMRGENEDKEAESE